MKAHKTVTLTRRMLSQAGACRDGINEVEALLPAVISTDPLDNLDLADKALRLRPHRCECDSNANFLPDPKADYLSYHPTVPDQDVVPEVDGFRNHEHENWNDPYVLAQQLAGWADAYLVARGQ